MLVFRSMVLGLLGACVLLLAQRPITHIHVDASRPSVVASLAAPASPTPAPTIIDLALRYCYPNTSGVHACFASEPLELLKLAPGERVTAVGDTQVEGWWAIKQALDGQAYRGDGQYIDLTIAGGDGERRALLLLHGP